MRVGIIVKISPKTSGAFQITNPSYSIYEQQKLRSLKLTARSHPQVEVLRHPSVAARQLLVVVSRFFIVVQRLYPVDTVAGENPILTVRSPLRSSRSKLPKRIFVRAETGRHGCSTNMIEHVSNNLESWLNHIDMTHTVTFLSDVFHVFVHVLSTLS